MVLKIIAVACPAMFLEGYGGVLGGTDIWRNKSPKDGQTPEEPRQGLAPGYARCEPRRGWLPLLGEEQERNPRLLDYMRQSGHFEFGLDRRPMVMGDPEASASIIDLWDNGHEVAGWAHYWRHVHSRLLCSMNTADDIRERILVIIHEDLCHHSRETLERIYAHLQLPVDNSWLTGQSRRFRMPSYYAPEFSRGKRRIIDAETADLFQYIRALAGSR